MKLKISSRQAATKAESWLSRSSGDILFWVVGLGGFAYALARALAHAEYDLRTPPVLVGDAVIAAAVLLGYAARSEGFEWKKGILRCLPYGLWSAAVFQLTLPVMGKFGEDVIFDTRFYSPDAPFIIVFAAIHGMLVMLLAGPFAARALQAEEGLPAWADDELIQVTAATVLLFFLVAAVVRLLVEGRW